MISPNERRPFYLSTLPAVRLLAVLAYTDHEGNLKEIDGMRGKCLSEDAVQISEGAIWALKRGDIVQFFPRGNELLKDMERVDIIDDPPFLSAGRDITLVVSVFEGGLLSLSRGIRYAGDKTLNQIEAFRELIALNDDDLGFVLQTNLDSPTSVAEHRTNLAEVEALIKSNSVLAAEIRGYIEAMKSPNDKTGRHNVWRMVLIVRAIQRRAAVIATDKGNTLQAITQIEVDVAKYVGAVSALTSRIASELNDVQPWWTQDEPRRKRQSTQMLRSRLIERLTNYRNNLKLITAKPFRKWAEAAAKAITAMIDGLRSQNYEDILLSASKAVGCSKVILARIEISSCVLESAAGEEPFESAGRWLRAINEARDAINTAIGRNDEIERVVTTARNAAPQELPGILREMERAVDRALIE